MVFDVCLFIHLSVCLVFIQYGLLTRKRNGAEKLKLLHMFQPGAG